MDLSSIKTVNIIGKLLRWSPSSRSLMYKFRLLELQFDYWAGQPTRRSAFYQVCQNCRCQLDSQNVVSGSIKRQRRIFLSNLQGRTHFQHTAWFDVLHFHSCCKQPCKKTQTLPIRASHRHNATNCSPLAFLEGIRPPSRSGYQQKSDLLAYLYDPYEGLFPL